MGLLALPLELREQIYKQCLRANIDITIPTETFPRSREGRLGEELFALGDRAAPQDNESKSKEWRLLPLLTLSLTCRAIFQDLRSMFESLSSSSQDDIVTWVCTLNLAWSTESSLVWTSVPCPPKYLKNLVVHCNQPGGVYHLLGDGGPDITMNVPFDIFKYFIFNGPTLRMGPPLKTPIHLNLLTFRVVPNEVYNRADLYQVSVLAKHLASPMFRGAVDQIREEHDGLPVNEYNAIRQVPEDSRVERWAVYGFVWKCPE